MNAIWDKNVLIIYSEIYYSSLTLFSFLHFNIVIKNTKMQPTADQKCITRALWGKTRQSVTAAAQGPTLQPPQSHNFASDSSYNPQTEIIEWPHTFIMGTEFCLYRDSDTRLLTTISRSPHQKDTAHATHFGSSSLPSQEALWNQRTSNHMQNIVASNTVCSIQEI